MITDYANFLTSGDTNKLYENLSNLHFQKTEKK